MKKKFLVMLLIIVAMGCSACYDAADIESLKEMVAKQEAGINDLSQIMVWHDGDIDSLQDENKELRDRCDDLEAEIRELRYDMGKLIEEINDLIWEIELYLLN